MTIFFLVDENLIYSIQLIDSVLLGEFLLHLYASHLRLHPEHHTVLLDILQNQAAGDKDLMALGYWYSQINAQIGDLIRVTFTSPADVVLEKL